MSSNLDRIEAEAKEHIAVRDQHYAEYGEEHFCEDYGCHNMGRFAVDALALVNVAKAAKEAANPMTPDGPAAPFMWLPANEKLREELAALELRP